MSGVSLGLYTGSAFAERLQELKKHAAKTTKVSSQEHHRNLATNLVNALGVLDQSLKSSQKSKPISGLSTLVAEAFSKLGRSFFNALVKSLKHDSGFFETAESIVEEIIDRLFLATPLMKFLKKFFDETPAFLLYKKSRTASRLLCYNLKQLGLIDDNLSNFHDTLKAKIAKVDPEFQFMSPGTFNRCVKSEKHDKDLAWLQFVNDYIESDAFSNIEGATDYDFYSQNKYSGCGHLSIRGKWVKEIYDFYSENSCTDEG